MALYPLKFKPIVLPKVWGSESWVVSTCDGKDSVVTNGYLKDNTLQEIIGIYLDELIGGKVYEQYGERFPILCKFIHVNDNLSVQVHPDDDHAEQYDSGKTEMWYVHEATDDAAILLGFNRDTSADEVRALLHENRITDILRRQAVQQGDVAYIPAGRVHALCKGAHVAEIQQNSDTTYRLYDYNRPGLDGKLRPLHIEEALRVLDFTGLDEPLLRYEAQMNDASNLVSDPHFTTNLLRLDRPLRRETDELDSFIVYMCVAGKVRIECPDDDCESVVIGREEAVLIPASLTSVRLVPDGEAELLETYV